MAQLENLKDTPLIRDRVYDALRKEILMGGFAPGETLNILSISKQMGISCAPIREALNMLNKDGLVELMPYKKAVVADGTQEDYDVAFDLRLMLEPYAIRHSVEAISDEEIAQMRLRLQSTYDNAGSVAEFYDCDNDFHHLLYRHVDSKLLISTLDTVRTYTMRYYTRRFDMIVAAKRKLYQDDSYDQQKTIRDETKEHMEILDAVAARDGAKAAQLLSNHISLTSNAFE